MTEAPGPATEPTHPRKTISAIVAIQATLVFSLGVLGNKVAERLSIPPVVLIAALLALLGASIALELALLRQRMPDGKLLSLTLRRAAALTGTLLHRPATAFPLGLMAGATISATCAYLVPSLGQGDLIIYNGFGPWLYEIVATLIGLVILLFASRSRAGSLAIRTFALGLGLGSAGGVLFVKPDNNETLGTTLWYVVLYVAASLMVRSNTGDALAADIRRGLRRLFTRS